MSTRLAIDIGGTFTDVVLQCETERFTTKVLTTHVDPSDGALAAVATVLDDSSIKSSSIELVVHGTTLATNALIQRRGAKTALLTTAGHRDVIEMAFENRFDQYDLNIDRARPLVPRALRLPIAERIDAAGEVVTALDAASVDAALDILETAQIESVAIGFLHSYVNPKHEELVAARLHERLMDVAVSRSSAVCPEIREYERFSTTCANAYVLPLMSRYLVQLESQLVGLGISCPMLMMTSGGGLTTFETAARFPIRLVESGPAGGAILAAQIAAELNLDKVLSFDMGGTTAKICLIDSAVPQFSRAFEVDRRYRFKKGSGLPVRIPVIEMVEIGAGGGSIASVDNLSRVRVGPESTGSEPGPACYGKEGRDATVTDADVVMGRIDEERFASGNITLDVDAAARAVKEAVGDVLDFDLHHAAFAISEIVDENMATAARSHASEWGKALAGRTLIAFGGAAPIHAARLASKLGIERVLIPADASVGSAIGFLIAPVSYEVVRSRYLTLSAFDGELIQAVIAEMREEATAIVSSASIGQSVTEITKAYMRYIGQGYEVAVEFDPRYTKNQMIEAFEESYADLYGRIIPGLDIEVLSWTLTLTAERKGSIPIDETSTSASHDGDYPMRLMNDDGQLVPTKVISRDQLSTDEPLQGPMLVIEDQTTTVVPSRFAFHLDARGHVVMESVER
ncbi:MAG: hydantoinase/oxoprolinase family protein [Pseudomonadota bacterium]|nr:hydantoinase/oxoprolinase family protein [Pseudomonadota bacterium]MED5555051.1 hydantoinase/oxoprolinase family protein [Pseudomonadota bacterium]